MRFRLVCTLLAAAIVAAPLRAQNQAPPPIACVVNGVAQTVTSAGDRTIDTTNIQSAIDACTTVGASAGRPVYIQLLPGNFVIKPITMKSWVYLLMPAGVVLNASTVTTDYQVAGSGTCGGIASSSSGCKPLISAGTGSDKAAATSGSSAAGPSGSWEASSKATAGISRRMAVRGGPLPTRRMRRARNRSVPG